MIDFSLVIRPTRLPPLIDEVCRVQMLNFDFIFYGESLAAEGYCRYTGLKFVGDWDDSGSPKDVLEEVFVEGED